MTNPEISKKISSAVLRILLYSAIVTSVILVFTTEAQVHKGPDLFNEESWTEWLQVAFLLTTTLILILIGRENPDESSLTTLMAGLTTIAFIREFDFLLDAHVFDGAWQTLAAITAILIIFLVFRQRATLLHTINRFLSRPSFGIFLSSFLTIFIFSRLFGRKVLWYTIMGQDGFIRAVKNGAEEGTELFGYCLMMIASIEYFLEIRAQKKQTEVHKTME